MLQKLRFDVIFLFLCWNQIQAKNSAKLDPRDYMTKDYLLTQDFSKSVMKIVQRLEGADVDCKIENGIFSYYDYTNRCEKCSTYCSSPTPGMKKRCIEKCDSFLIHQQASNRTMAIESRLLVLETNMKQNSDEINNLKYWVTGLSVAVAFLILIVLIGFLICHHFLPINKLPQYDYRNQIQPTSDVKDQIYRQSNERRNDDEVCYSNLQSNRNEIAYTSQDSAAVASPIRLSNFTTDSN